MSKFFKALEQAAQEQARRRHPAPSEPMRERGPAVIETELPEAPRASGLEPPRAVADGLEEHLVSLLAPTSFERHRGTGRPTIVDPGGDPRSQSLGAARETAHPGAE